MFTSKALVRELIHLSKLVRIHELVKYAHLCFSSSQPALQPGPDDPFTQIVMQVRPGYDPNVTALI